MSMLNRHIVIVNSAQMAADMLESKGSIYSDRGLTPMLELAGWGNEILLTQPGPSFRQQRAYIHKLFGTQLAHSNQYSIIEGESQRFLRQVLSSPDDLAQIVRHFSGSIFLRIKYIILQTIMTILLFSELIDS